MTRRIKYKWKKAFRITEFYLQSGGGNTVYRREIWVRFQQLDTTQPASPDKVVQVAISVSSLFPQFCSHLISPLWVLCPPSPFARHLRERHPQKAWCCIINTQMLARPWGCWQTHIDTFACLAGFYEVWTTGLLKRGDCWCVDMVTVCCLKHTWLCVRLSPNFFCLWFKCVTRYLAFWQSTSTENPRKCTTRINVKYL